MVAHRSKIENFVFLLTLVTLIVLFLSSSTRAQDAAVPTGGIGRWQAVTKVENGQTSLYMRLPASPKPTDGSSYEFVLHCKAKSTDAYVEWKAFGDGSHDAWGSDQTVFYNFDDEPGVYEKWDVSGDKYELSSQNAIALIQSMHDKKALRIIADPKGVPPGNPMIFNLSGLEGVLSQLFEVCYK